jgi:hypothetical protein
VKSAGFSFQDDSVRKVDVNVSTFLDRFRDEVDVFAKNEAYAEHVLEAAKSRNNDALRALDAKQWNAFSGGFWQSRDWWFRLSEVVPFLIAELLKYQPKNLEKLSKAFKSWTGKPWRWSPSGDTFQTVPEKYLSVLKSLRDQLAECQKAAANVGSEGVASVSVGKFELYDSLGVEDSTKAKVIAALKQATKAMTTLGLGTYCYGKVTIVESFRLASRSAAFYSPNTDEMYVSPEMSGQEVRAVCHEIMHRVSHKLNLSQRAKTLYDFCSDHGLWVTPYAKTNAEENLCEMVSFAAIGKLPKEGEDSLRLAVPKIKLAAVNRLVCRWVQERASV